MDNAAGAVSSNFPTTPATANSTPTVPYECRDERKRSPPKSPSAFPSRNMNHNRSTQNDYFQLPRQNPDVALKDLPPLDTANDEVNNDNEDDVSEAETIIQSALPSESREPSPDRDQSIYMGSNPRERKSPYEKGNYDRLQNSSSPAPSQYEEQPRKKQRLEDGRPMDVSPLEGNIRSKNFPRRRTSSESARSSVPSPGSSESRHNEQTKLPSVSPSISTSGHSHSRIKQEKKSSPSGRTSPSESASTGGRPSHQIDRTDDRRSMAEVPPFPHSLSRSQTASHIRRRSLSPKHRGRSKSNISGVTSSASSDLRRERELSRERDCRSSASPYPSSSLRKTSSGEPRMPRRRRDQNGRTPLARACAAQEFASAKYHYAETPSDLNVPDNAGNTPLQIASLEGSAEIVDFLINRGCEIETKNIDKDTPLIDAVENGHLDVVRRLLDAGANPRVGNAQGDEPFDLAPSDCEEYNQIRQAIFDAKAKDMRRRKSEDHQRTSVSVPQTNRTSPPPQSTTPRNLTPSLGSARRKTVRSEATRNDLLWTKPTFQNLRHFAAKGDMEGVATILNVLQKADTESLIAAVKGGHDEVLGLLLGMGDPEPDPQPLSHLKSGYNTPMLAAIGRGNTQIVQLLLEQRGFNPTRRPYDGRTYYELSKGRKGDNHEAEFELLKKAYDDYSRRKDERASENLKRRPENDRSQPRFSSARQQKNENYSPRSRDEYHASRHEYTRGNIKQRPISPARETHIRHKESIGESPLGHGLQRRGVAKPVSRHRKENSPADSETLRKQSPDGITKSRPEQQFRNTERFSHYPASSWDSSSRSSHPWRQPHTRPTEEAGRRDSLPAQSPISMAPESSPVKIESNYSNVSPTDITMKNIDQVPPNDADILPTPSTPVGKSLETDEPVDGAVVDNRPWIHRDSIARKPEGFAPRERDTHTITKTEHDRPRRMDQESSRGSRVRKEREDKEMHRRSLLPMRLSAAANYIGSNDPLARQPIWLRHFLPLFTVTTQQIDEKCLDEDKDEKWVPNFLVAPLLATNDLQLSQCEYFYQST